MPICPFSHDYRECYSTCALYAEAVARCSFYVSAMLLEDLQKIAVISYERYVREEEQYLKQRLEEMEDQEQKPKIPAAPRTSIMPAAKKTSFLDPGSFQGQDKINPNLPPSPI